MRRTCRIPLVVSVCALLLTISVPAAAGTIVVKPGRLERFKLTVPKSALAGESFLVRIEPYDANGNLIIDPPSKGSIFNVRVSGSAEVTPDKIRPVDFAGGITVKVTDKVAEIVEISVLEGGAQTPLASERVPVYPNSLDHFTLVVPGAAVSGEPFQCRIIARDAFGNAKIDLPDIRSGIRVEFAGTGTIRRPDRQLPPFRSGEAIVSFEPVKAGKVKIAVEEQTTHSRGESDEIDVSHAGLHHFVVQGPKAAVAGEKFSLTLSAMDRNENVVTKYQSQGDGVLLLPSGDGLLDPATVNAKDFRSGQAKVNVSYTASGTLRITARELNSDFEGVSEPISVVASEPNHFIVKTPEEAVAGEAFTIEIHALDRFNNFIEDYDLRGLEVFLSTDGSGSITPSSVSPSAFKTGKAKVEISYDRAESFSVIAALSKDDLEKIAQERSRRAPVAPGPSPLSPEEIAAEKEREEAMRARQEAMKARTEVQEQKKARDEAVRAREEAQKALEEVSRKTQPEPPEQPAPAPPPPAVPEPAPQDDEMPARVELPKRPPPVQVARRTVQELSQVSFIESKGQAMIRLETTGPVSYNAATGSALSKEWVYVEIFPVKREKAKVADLVKVESELVGDIRVEDLGEEKIKISLQILPPGISYVVSQQDRSVVVKIIKND